MSGYGLAAVVALARGWTWLYTRGIDAEAREERRREIDSDIWETLEDGGTTGASTPSVALQMLARVVLGILDDVRWRVVDAPRAVQPPGLWWATTATALFLAAVVGIVALIAAAPAKLPVPTPAAPFVPHLRTNVPPPPPPPPPQNRFQVTRRPNPTAGDQGQ